MLKFLSLFLSGERDVVFLLNKVSISSRNTRPTSFMLYKTIEKVVTIDLCHCCDIYIPTNLTDFVLKVRLFIFWFERIQKILKKICNFKI